MKHSKFILLISIFLISLGGIQCEKKEPLEEIVPIEAERTITKAVAVLHPTEGSDVHGMVTFTEVADGIEIIADVQGLSPGKHAFHIHDYGDCSVPDATSAGGHFNPEGMPHGAPTDIERHVGDLGNLEADSEGKAHYERIDNHISFSGSHSIVGLAVIIHAGEDDFVSQPTGNAGARIACGVIGVANPQKRE
jgi:Cu-Zn family superoxide dismutase